ncbi:tRNA pseudouridine(38-40) synthase TruA [Eubacteriales bacterium OttesenSCG-928-M02]|nr:tRNA pseudouridine(38-40) synthase TruA [Eubacteriales bacterium OttesenSCG-928-M02]
MRIKAICEYDGTDYGGWQRQKNAMTIQERIEDALMDLLDVKTPITGAGRTDAGVHARGQVFHFDTDTRIPPEKLAYGVNFRLPDDIRVKETSMVAADFHARFSPVGKWYRYRMYHHPIDSPLMGRYSWHIPYPRLEEEQMERSIQCLVGTHDFLAFSAAGSQMKTSVRTIEEISFRREEDMVLLDIKGDGFLYNMVRIIAGTAADIGRGKLPVDTFATMLETKRRTDGGTTAPGKGLCLMEVYY